MTPFALAIRDEGFDHPKLQKSPDATESLHNIQSHTADLPLLEKAHQKQCQVSKEQEDEDDTSSSITVLPETSSPGRHINLLTPPRSNSKVNQACGDDFNNAKTLPRKTDKRRQPLWGSEVSKKCPRKKSPTLV